MFWRFVGLVLSIHQIDGLALELLQPCAKSSEYSDGKEWASNAKSTYDILRLAILLMHLHLEFCIMDEFNYRNKYRNTRIDERVFLLTNEA